MVEPPKTSTESKPSEKTVSEKPQTSSIASEKPADINLEQPPAKPEPEKNVQNKKTTSPSKQFALKTAQALAPQEDISFFERMMRLFRAWKQLSEKKETQSNKKPTEAPQPRDDKPIIIYAYPEGEKKVPRSVKNAIHIVAKLSDEDRIKFSETFESYLKNHPDSKASLETKGNTVIAHFPNKKEAEKFLEFGKKACPEVKGELKAIIYGGTVVHNKMGSSDPQFVNDREESRADLRKGS